MNAPRLLLAALLVVTAVLAQTTVVARPDLPFGRPDLVVVVVVAIALAGGATAGMSAGFGAGLLVDLQSDHPAGVMALVLCLTGFACGLLAPADPAGRPNAMIQGKLVRQQQHQSSLDHAGGASRTALRGLGAVAGATAAAMLGHAGFLAIIGSPRLDWRVVATNLPGSAAYDVLLALVVLPAVVAIYRRLES